MRGFTRTLPSVIRSPELHAFRNRQLIFWRAVSNSSARHAGKGGSHGGTGGASSILGLGISAAAATVLAYYLTTRHPSAPKTSRTGMEVQPKDREEFDKKLRRLLAMPGVDSEMEIIRTISSHYFSPTNDFVITSTGPLTKQPFKLPVSGKELLPSETCGWVIEKVQRNPSSPLAEPQRWVHSVVPYAHVDVVDQQPVIMGVVQSLEKLDQWGILGPQTFAIIYLGTTVMCFSYSTPEDQGKFLPGQSQQGFPPISPPSRKQLYPMVAEGLPVHGL
jgi:hypothetical protein